MKTTPEPFLIITGWLHSLTLFLGFYPLAAALLKRAGDAQIISLLAGFFLLLPIAASWYAVRRLRHLTLYLIVSLLFSGGFGVLMHFLCPVCAYPHLSESAVFRTAADAAAIGGAAPDRIFRSGTPCPEALLSLALALLIFFIRGHARVRKGALRRSLRDMPSSPSQNTDGSVPAFEDIPAFLDVPHPAHWRIPAICYICGALLKSSVCWHAAFYLTLADILLCFAWQFPSGFDWFLREHSRVASLPAKTMRRVAGILFVILFILLLLSAVPAILFQREPLSGLTFGRKTDVSLPPDTPAPPAEATPGTERFLPPDTDLPAYEPPEWLAALMTGLQYLFCTGTALFILAAIYHACRNAGAFFASGTEDEIHFLKKDTSESVRRLKRPRKKSASDQTPCLKIRRLYKKAIRRGLQTPPTGSETPEELEIAAGLGGSEHLQLHEYYEKARYSREGCTAEEAAEYRLISSPTK